MGVSHSAQLKSALAILPSHTEKSWHDMKITYEVEFDITLREGAKFPEPEIAHELKKAVEGSSHRAFVEALYKVDDDFTKTDKTPVADIFKWRCKVTEIAM